MPHGFGFGVVRDAQRRLAGARLYLQNGPYGTLPDLPLRWPLLRMQFVVDVLLSPLTETKERYSCVQVTSALLFVNASALQPELSLEPTQCQPV